MPDYDLIVIGAGPGGYVAAIRAAQLGLKTACVEKEALLGGTCLRVGCIPSKALLESCELYHEAKTKSATHVIKLPSVELDLAAMLKRKYQIVLNLTKGVEGLLKKNNITRLLGQARLVAPSKEEIESKEGKNTIEAKHLVIATGSKPANVPGVEIDRDRVGTSTEARASGNGAIVECAGEGPIECDRVLMSVGRVPNTDNLGVEQLGIRMDKRGRIEVDPHFATSVPNIYAIGDVIAGPMLAHKAEDEGVAVAEILAGQPGHVNYDVIPNVVYTYPEIASVGKSEEELKQTGIVYNV